MHAQNDANKSNRKLNIPLYYVSDIRRGHVDDLALDGAEWRFYQRATTQSDTGKAGRDNRRDSGKRHGESLRLDVHLLY
jgi:hypothetical protein